MEDCHSAELGHVELRAPSHVPGSASAAGGKYLHRMPRTLFVAP